MNCSQCNRPAVYNANGHPLCVEHAAIVSNMHNQTARNLMAMMNDAENSIEASFGLAPRRPIQIPRNIIHNSNTTVNQNNINIDRSTIGVLNTGTVGTLNSSVNDIHNTDPTLAKNLKDLIEKISSNHELGQNIRKETIEEISFIISQVPLPEKERNISVVKKIMGAIGVTLSASADILTLWQTVEPALKAHLGL